MKKLGAILTVLVALGMLGGFTAVPAKAAASGAETAYVRLVPESALNANGDFAVAGGGEARGLLASQANQAYYRLLPGLMEAQSKGVILDFRPELSFGMLMIEYQAGADLKGVVGDFSVYATADAAIVSVPTAQAGIAVINPTFYAGVFDSCFNISNVPAGYKVLVVLKNGAGKTKAFTGGTASSGGYYYGCLYGAGNVRMRPGYKLIYKIYQPDGTMVARYANKIPNLKFAGLNNKAAQVSVSGPKGKPFSVQWSHQVLNKDNDVIYGTKAGNFSAKGKGKVDMGTTPFRGGDLLYVETVSGSFTFNRTMVVPVVFCVLDNQFCLVTGFAFKPAFFEVTRNGVTYRDSGKFDYSGTFYANFGSGNGNFGDVAIPADFRLKPGDVVRGTKISKYKLPNLTSSLNYAKDVIAGRVPKGSYFDLRLDAGYTSVESWAHSNSSGVYKDDLSSVIDLKASDPYQVQIYFQHKTKGNITVREYFFAR